MNKKELNVTRSACPLNHPHEVIDLTSPISWSLHYSLEEAVEKFKYHIDGLDAGCVQLWLKNNNNDTWAEIGYLFL